MDSVSADTNIKGSDWGQKTDRDIYQILGFQLSKFRQKGLNELIMNPVLLVECVH